MKKKEQSKNQFQLATDDVLPTFLAKKLELCHKLDSIEPCSPSPKRPPSSATDQFQADGPDAIATRKRELYLKNLLASKNLNHKQKEHLSQKILLGEPIMIPKAPLEKINSTGILRTASDSILAEGNRLRHTYRNRNLEIVSDPIEVTVASTKALQLQEIQRQKHGFYKTGFSWAGEYIEAEAPKPLPVKRSLNTVEVSANRDFIVEEILKYNRYEVHYK
jgi:hypothetical protein